MDDNIQEIQELYKDKEQKKKSNRERVEDEEVILIKLYKESTTISKMTETTKTLLFLLPPSCMVVPIGKFANKFSFSTHFSKSNMASNFDTSLPPMSNNMDLGMDIQLGVFPNINSKERG